MNGYKIAGEFTITCTKTNGDNDQQKEINILDFGAVGDGVADDTRAIQSAIDYSIYGTTPNGTSKGSVFFPSGLYRITDTIHLGYGTGFRSAHIYGDGVRYRSSPSFCGTGVIADFNDRPAFAISGGRNSSIKKMTIQGANESWITSQNLGTTAVQLNDDLVESNWVDPTFPQSASSRFAPYAAIAVDPYAGPKPEVSYPDVTFPEWMGDVSQYGKVFSSACVFEDINIGGFVVGIANQPCNADGNGDYTKCNRVYIEHCQFGISIGNSQSRLFEFSNGSVVKAHTGIVTAKHGRQAGKPSFSVRSSELGCVINWLQVPNVDYGGCPSFENCYGEVIYRIGNIGTNASGSSPVSFRNCEFAFTSSWDVRGVPSDVLTVSGYSNIVFDGCIFDPGTTRFMSLVIDHQMNAELLMVDSCQFAVGQTDTPPIPFQYALKATDGIVFGNARKPGSFKHNRMFGSTTGWFSGLNVTNNYRDFSGSIIGDIGVQNIPGDNAIINKGSLPIPTVSGSNVTYTFAGYTDWVFVQRGLDVGDCVWDTQTRTNNVVISRTGNDVTLRACSGIDKDGNLLIAPALSGHLYAMKTRVFTVQNAVLYGNTSASSNKMSGIARDDGYSGTFLSDEKWGVSVGDYVLSSSEFDQVVNSTGTKIVSVDPDSFTVAGSFKNSATHRRLPLFIHKPPENI